MSMQEFAFRTFCEYWAVKLAAILFLLALSWAYRAAGFEQPWRQPLCAFRQGDCPAAGYAAFGALGLLGLAYHFDLRWSRRAEDAANAAGSGLLLVMIAATPAHWTLHEALAFVLMFSIYAYFGILLLSKPRPLLAMHGSVPLLLAAGAGTDDYGLWQQGMIGYLVALATIHHHLATRRPLAT